MNLIEKIWYSPLGWRAWPLLPLSALFAVVAAARRGMFRLGWIAAGRLPVPVVVVGNLTAGGAGKTPLTLYLVRELAARGWRPGIISRGYRGKVDAPMAVTPQTDPALSGDEPVLLARAGVPVFVCPSRFAAGQALLVAHPEVNVILCDDGLQHYRLARDIELCVVDGARMFGNKQLLPAGPLREPVSRLRSVDAVVINGATKVLKTTSSIARHPLKEGTGGVGIEQKGCEAQVSCDQPRLCRDLNKPASHFVSSLALDHPAQFQMTLAPGAFYRLDDRQALATEVLAGKKLAALCGIGNPARFFATLRSLGLQFSEHPFPDHHAFTLADLPDADLILVTEKDAVKLTALPGLGALGAKILVLPVAARLEPNLTDWLEKRLRHGCQTA